MDAAVRILFCVQISGKERRRQRRIVVTDAGAHAFQHNISCTRYRTLGTQNRRGKHAGRPRLRVEGHVVGDAEDGEPATSLARVGGVEAGRCTAAKQHGKSNRTRYAGGDSPMHGGYEFVGKTQRVSLIFRW